MPLALDIKKLKKKIIQNLVSPNAVSVVQKAPKYAPREAYSASPGPLAGLKGLLLRGGDEREGRRSPNKHLPIHEVTYTTVCTAPWSLR